MEQKPKVLNIDDKIEVVYCIDLWLRDLQMRINLSKVADRLEPALIKSDEPVAIVGYGPSLNDTWEELKDFKIIISTSGAHKFLTDRGIIPTYHIDVDPREHKISLIGTPNKETIYLLASCIFPRYIDFLKEHDCKVILWHVFANGENGETCSNIFPRGEWCLTGGSDIFLRALTIARFLGYTNLHAFGKDGNISDLYGNHAASHPNQPKDHVLVEYGGKSYKTTSAYLACVKQMGHELDQMPDVKLVMHGEGLAQELFKSYTPEPIGEGKSIIAVKRPELMSQEYKELNKQLHESNQFYGVSGMKRVEMVKKLYEKGGFKSCLDYGCLPYNAEVVTENGIKSMKDIVENKYTGKVQSINNQGAITWNRVVDWLKRSNKDLLKSWVRLHTTKGRKQLVCTNDHPCGVIRDILAPNIEFLPADQVSNTYLVRNENLKGSNFNRENRLFNSEQLSVMLGIGLGDGYFDSKGALTVNHGLSQSEYIQYKQKLLGGSIIRVPPSRTGKSDKDGLMFTGKTNEQGKYLRKIFYPEGKKTVKNVLDKLDEISLAFWYMDDGRLKYINHVPYVEVHTEGFTDDDQVLIKEYFLKKWDIKASIYNTSLGHKFIHLNKEGSRKFFMLVSRHIHESMEYKLPEEFKECEKYKINSIPLEYSAVCIKEVSSYSKKHEFLYDITVENDHNFIANNSLVHNCGKGLLALQLDFPIWEFDPCMPGKDIPPRPAELTICTDVLEHIEPEYLPYVLDDLRRCTLKVGYFTISTRPAGKKLADGRNTHLIIKDKKWWTRVLSDFFDIGKVFDGKGEIQVIVSPKKSKGLTNLKLAE